MPAFCETKKFDSTFLHSYLYTRCLSIATGTGKWMGMRKKTKSINFNQLHRSHPSSKFHYFLKAPIHNPENKNRETQNTDDNFPDWTKSGLCSERLRMQIESRSKHAEKFQIEYNYKDLFH